jgi:hypothetical protein
MCVMGYLNKMIKGSCLNVLLHLRKLLLLHSTLITLLDQSLDGAHVSLSLLLVPQRVVLDQLGVLLNHLLQLLPVEALLLQLRQLPLNSLDGVHEVKDALDVRLSTPEVQLHLTVLRCR